MADGARDEAIVRSISAGERRLEFTIEINGRSYEIWYETSVPLAASPDAVVAACLVPAMSVAESLRIDEPLDPALIDNLPSIQEILRTWRWYFDCPRGELEPVEVRCPGAKRPQAPRGQGEGLFFSGGVDSFEAVVSRPEISHLIFVGGFDIHIDDPHLGEVRERIAASASALGKQLITVDTNLKQLTDELVPWLACFGAAMASVAMLLAPAVSKVNFASSISYDAIRPNGSHPLLDHLWSTSAVEVASLGAIHSRPRKLALIAGLGPAREGLRVCWAGPTAEFNCGRCEKCLRTMVMLEGLGVREHFRTFPPALDLDAVAALRVASPPLRDDWREMVPMLRRLGADPPLVAAAEACLENSRAPAVATDGPPATLDPEADTEAGLRAQIAVCEEERAHHQDKLVRAREELRAAQSQHRELGEIVARQDATLRELHNSSSWRLTDPLRRGRRLLGGLGRRRAQG